MSNENLSGLFPVGRAVLVKPYVPDIASGLIQLPQEVLNRTQSIEQRATVVAAGPEAWIDERQPRAKPGDRVLISKFSGYNAIGTSDGEQYRFINDRDIFALIGEEK